MSVTSDQQSRTIDRAIEAAVEGGAKVEARTETSATLSRQSPVSHTLHAVFSVLTGVWVFGWIYMATNRKVTAWTVRLNESGWVESEGEPTEVGDRTAPTWLAVLVYGFFAAMVVIAVVVLLSV